MTVKRRTFLKLAGLASAGAATGHGPAYAADALAEAPPVNLTEAEMKLLRLLLARMLPADEEGGGAVEAGAHVYIDRALGGYHARHLDTYRTSLAAVAVVLGKGPGSVEDQADALIGRMEKGTAGAGFPDGGTGFFGLLRTHMLEGTLGDPSYGGNRDYIGWQMIGFPGVQLVFSKAEQAVDGPRSAINRSIENFGGKATT